MEHNTNTFDKSQKSLLKVPPLYGFAMLILVIVLLVVLIYTALRKDDFSLLSYLDSLASIVLKVSFTYFSIEGARFLQRCRKQLSYRSTKKQENKQDTAVFAAEGSSKDKKETPPVSDPLVTQNNESCMHTSVQNISIPPVEKYVDVRGRERATSPRQLRFGFQDTDQSTRVALDIMEGIRQGPIILASSDKGELIGKEIYNGDYLVVPEEEYLTETELRYSPVAACFEVNWSTTRIGQKVKVRCDKPAILTEVGDGMYRIVERGLLTVICSIR